MDIQVQPRQTSLIVRILPMVAIGVGVVLLGIGGFSLFSLAKLFGRGATQGNVCKLQQTMEGIPAADTNIKILKAAENKRKCRYLRLHFVAVCCAITCAFMQISLSVVYLLIPWLKKLAINGFGLVFLLNAIGMMLITLTIGFFSQEAAFVELSLDDKSPAQSGSNDTYADDVLEETNNLVTLHRTRKLLAPVTAIDLIFVLVFMIFNCDVIPHENIM